MPRGQLPPGQLLSSQSIATRSVAARSVAVKSVAANSVAARPPVVLVEVHLGDVAGRKRLRLGGLRAVEGYVYV